MEFNAIMTDLYNLQIFYILHENVYIDILLKR